MADNTGRRPAAGKVSGKASGPIEKERSEFTVLLAQNPNYFGNLAASAFKPVKKIVGNTKYEELSCLGYNPKLKQLEATVQVKLPFGFSGDLCRHGSMQYVRFFVDYGGGWEDAGMVSVDVHDIPNAVDCARKPDKPLTYVLTHPIEPKTGPCNRPVLPKVRGILSWNVPPPAGPANANWPPVWGNVLDRFIQVMPRPRYIIDVIDHLGIADKIPLPPELEIIKDKPILLPDPPPFIPKDLVKLYATGKSLKSADAFAVAPHRFLTAEAQPFLATAPADQYAIESNILAYKELGLDWSAILQALEKTKGNVSYEELTCLGLDYNRDWLVGTFVVKRPTGYSGSPCGKGSIEYVSFWVDWGNTCEWVYAGTATVPVYDFSTIPVGGLHYAAVMPVDPGKFRRPCKEPRIARVRAVLSWNVAPSTTDPDAIPHWGNRIDTHVLLRPGKSVEVEPKISILGGIGVAYINTTTTGMTKPFAPFAGWGPGVLADPWDGSRSCPFGGVIHLQSDPVPGYRYKLWAQNLTTSAPPQQLVDPVWVTDHDGNSSLHHPGPGGVFEYLPVSQNLFSMLYSQWSPHGDDLWQVRLELYSAGGTYLGSTPWHRIQLDNTAPSTVSSPPTLDIHIDSGGDCKDFKVDDIITGRFVARDTHFGHFSLTTLPASMSPNAPVPASGNTETSVYPGDPWKLDTKNMVPCGYVLLLQAWDRSVVNSHPGAHNYNKDDVGFCLRAK